MASEHTRIHVADESSASVADSKSQHRRAADTLSQGPQAKQPTAPTHSQSTRTGATTLQQQTMSMQQLNSTLGALYHGLTSLQEQRRKDNEQTSKLFTKTDLALAGYKKDLEKLNSQFSELNDNVEELEERVAGVEEHLEDSDDDDDQNSEHFAHHIACLLGNNPKDPWVPVLDTRPAGFWGGLAAGESAIMMPSAESLLLNDDSSGNLKAILSINPNHCVFREQEEGQEWQSYKLAHEFEPSRLVVVADPAGVETISTGNQFYWKTKSGAEAMTYRRKANGEIESQSLARYLASIFPKGKKHVANSQNDHRVPGLGTQAFESVQSGHHHKADVLPPSQPAHSHSAQQARQVTSQSTTSANRSFGGTPQTEPSADQTAARSKWDPAARSENATNVQQRPTCNLQSAGLSNMSYNHGSLGTAPTMMSQAPRSRDVDIHYHGHMTDHGSSIARPNLSMTSQSVSAGA